MIRIFNSTDTVFTDNGERILHATKAKIHKEDNGDYYLDIEVGIEAGAGYEPGSEYISLLAHGNIIVAPTPSGNQAFRVNNPQIKKNKITARCWHVFYDTQEYLIANSYVYDKNCNDALDHLKIACDQVPPFTTISDVTTVHNFRCIRHSFYEAIGAILERWGGHLVRDNFKIEIRNTIGKDNGVLVQYKKNLKDITRQDNWDNVVTKLMPVGRDGLLLSDKLEEQYITSDIQYSTPYTKKVSFTQEVDEEPYKNDKGELDEEAYTKALRDDLADQARAYLERNKRPQVNYTIKANLEKLTDVGDIVYVKDERLGVQLTTNVISYDYDCILQKYTSIEFGNFKNNLSGLINNISSATQEAIEKSAETTTAKLKIQLRNAGEKIWGALGSSYIIYEGDRIMVVDNLPKETAQNVILINSGGIAFGRNGINGAFNSAWTIDGTMDMQNIECINFVADIIKGGTLKLGSNLDESGKIEIFDEANTLIGEINKNGVLVHATDGSYVIINNEVGFAGYDKDGNKIYWASKDEFHMKKSVVEEEITLCNKMRFIPITITENGTIVSDGIGLVSTIN